MGSAAKQDSLGPGPTSTDTSVASWASYDPTAVLAESTWVTLIQNGLPGGIFSLWLLRVFIFPDLRVFSPFIP